MRKNVCAFMALFATCFLPAIAQTQNSAEETDSISLPGYQELDELVIAADKPVLQTDGAKLTYNVDEDPAAESSNVLDMLKKVPQVSVDGEGNIRLNGSQAFKFQINGMDNPMLKQYASQMLQSMPASMVVKIEVITEPGAKEDAEGTAGIINLITERKQSQDGYSGNISLQAGNRGLTPSLYGILKKNNFTISANVNYQWGYSPQRGEQTSNAIYHDTDNAGNLETVVGQKAKHHYVGGSMNMSWEPNLSNLFTAGADVFYVDGNIYNLYGTTRRYDPAGVLQWSFRQNGFGNMKMFSISANASYKHTFAHEGKNYLVLSYLYNFGRNNLWIDRTYSDLVNYTPAFMSEYQGSNAFNRGHTVQADYVNDFNSKHHLMEAGVKGIFRHNTALADYKYGRTVDDLVSFPELNSNLLQPQNIYSAYLSYTGNFGVFGVVGGLRYEHTLMGITNRYDSKENFRNHLNDWVPNAALTWNLSSASNFRLAYQMRISRPSIDQVNPFELSFTPYEVRKGNPDLTSERNHILSLKYSAFGRVVGGTIGVEYNLANNAISGFTFLRELDGINTIVTTYANIGKKQDVALTGFFNWSIISKMNLSFNGRLAYNKLKAPAEGFSNRGWSGNIGAAWNYTVADVYKFSAYGAWFSRSLSVQGYSTGFHYYGLSAARDFLKDKSLTVSLSANNFFEKTMTFKSFTDTPNVTYHNIGKSFTFWSVGISISWKFGNQNTKVKQTGVEIKNDDINSSSNKSQGSGL